MLIIMIIYIHYKGYIYIYNVQKYLLYTVYILYIRLVGLSIVNTILLAKKYCNGYEWFYTYNGNTTISICMVIF